MAPEPRAFRTCVPTGASGTRLDRFIAAWLTSESISRSRIQSLCREGLVRVDGEVHKASMKLKGGEWIEVSVPAPQPSALLPQDIPLEILHEDLDIAVINKQAGLVVHPARGSEQGTLVHALLHHLSNLSGINGEERPGIVHRLDKDTSGVLVIAKNDRAHQRLAAQFKAHTITRRYHALVRGQPPLREGVWQTRLGRNPRNRLKMASVPRGGREAITHYTLLEVLPGSSLLELTLETGRTHQIRVHASEAGIPVLNDQTYGGHSWRGLPEDAALREALAAAPRQMLHARQLGFAHPRDGHYVAFVAEPPEDFQRILRVLRHLGGDRPPVDLRAR